MARKRRQALLQALLVANVRLDTLEHRDARAFLRRYEESRLRHQCQESSCLERDRLATRIGTRDQQDIEVTTQFEAYGHDRSGEERVAGIQEAEHGLSRA